MVKVFFMLMYVFVALFVLAHVPLDLAPGGQVWQAPLLWWVAAGLALVMFPCQLVRGLLLPLRAGLLVLVWLGTVVLALGKVVLVTLNRMNRTLAREARHDRSV